MSDLPQGWVEVRLGDVAAFEMGQAPPGSACNKDGIGTVFVKAGEFGRDRPIIREWTTQPLKFAKQGDVLICVVGATAGKINLGIDCAIGRSVAAIRPGSVLSQALLYRQLQCQVEQLRADSTGTAQGVISKQMLADIQVVVPPIAEQTRIADQLDTLLARVNACNNHLDAIPGILKRFRQAVLNAATSGSLTEDWRSSDIASWRRVLLSEVAKDFSYGSASKSASSGQVPVLRMGNIQGGRLDWTDLVYTSDSSEIEKYKLTKGDVLFNRTNSPELVGKTAVFQGEREAIYAGYLIRVRCTSDLLPEYLNYCLGSKAGRDYCWSVKSDGVSQSNINAKKLAAFLFSLPTLDEQREIVRRVEALFAQIDRIEARYTAMRAHAQRLAPQVLAKAFRGELVEQDPNDETAGDLLARLRTQRATFSTEKAPRRPSQPQTTRAPAEASSMTKSRQDEDVKGQPYLAGHLRRLGVPTTAQSLFKEAELPVADFYKQLAWEIAEGHVKNNETTLEPGHAAG